jgi:hypothetical protein
MPELVLRPVLCRRGSPLGVGMPVLLTLTRRATGVTALLPSLLSASGSRDDVDMLND